MGGLDDSGNCFFSKSRKFYSWGAILTLSAPLLEVIAVTTWAGFGTTIRVFISNNKIKKFIEILMAILLILTSAFILI